MNRGIEDTLGKLLGRFSFFAEPEFTGPNLFDEILIEDAKNAIFAKLGMEDLARANRVNRQWHDGTSSNNLWRTHSLALGPDDKHPHKQQYQEKIVLIKAKAKLLKSFIHQAPPGYKEWNAGVSGGFSGGEVIRLDNKEKFRDFDPRGYLRIHVFNSPILHPHAIVNLAITNGLNVNLLNPLLGRSLLHFLALSDNQNLLDSFLSQHRDILSINLQDARGNRPLAVAFTDIASGDKRTPTAALTLLKYGALLGEKEITIFESINGQKLMLNEQWRNLFLLMVEKGLDMTIIKKKFPPEEKQYQFLYQAEDASSNEIFTKEMNIMR